MSEPTPLVLAHSLDITAAAALVSDLRDRRGTPVSLDASNVRRVGGQCLQVLLSAQATWAADSQAFQVIDPSPEFAEGVALMGAPHLVSAGLGLASSVQD